MRYNAINPYLKSRFGEKVCKVTLLTDVTCPNRDGTLSSEGCIYCRPEGGLPLSLKNSQLDIPTQLKEGVSHIKKRHNANKFISYFQQYTNTYAPVSKLSKSFAEAINHPDVVGLAISTRPDCISEEVLELLTSLNKKIFMWVELGLQTANDRLLDFLNRGHSVKHFIDAVIRLHERKIDICAHTILGLPGETDKDILDTTRLLNELKIEGVKIHNLHILKDTPLEKMFRDGQIRPITLEEYTKKTILMLENLDPSILIHRFNSHAPRDITIAPRWSINKMATFNAIETELERRDTWQGKALGGNQSFFPR